MHLGTIAGRSIRPMHYGATLVALSLALGGCGADAGYGDEGFDDESLGEESLGTAEGELCAGAQLKVSGYAWADQPLAASYTPMLGYQHNSSGGTNTITRIAIGAYAVRFPGLSGGGTVGGTAHVTAYGAGPESCKMKGWNSVGGDIVVDVRCFDGSGAPVDTQYDISFSTYPTEVVNHGYVWANDPFAAFYTPTLFYQFNSSCAPNTITRTGTGSYTVKFPGLAAPPGDPQPGGTVKVTAYGFDSEICKVDSWSAIGADQYVQVRCFTAPGVPADTKFTATYTRGNNLFGQAAGKRGYVRADQPWAASYTPVLSDQFNSTGAANTVTHGALPGSYTVKFPGLATSGGHAQVSGAGVGTGRCKVVNWWPSGADEYVNVQCHTQTTAPTDSQFTLSFYMP